MLFRSSAAIGTLTDGTGKNRVVLRLSGRKTLRLRHITPDNGTGARYLNYLVFVPVADAGVQRAAVTSLSPTDGAVVETAEPKIEVAIQNRDTQVKTSSIQLSVNGVAVTPSVSAVATGAQVSHVITPLPAKGSVQQVRLVFADNEGVLQTNAWAFTVTYRELDPSVRMAGPGSERGFKVRALARRREHGVAGLAGCVLVPCAHRCLGAGAAALAARAGSQGTAQAQGGGQRPGLPRDRRRAPAACGEIGRVREQMVPAWSLRESIAVVHPRVVAADVATPDEE